MPIGKKYFYFSLIYLTLINISFGFYQLDSLKLGDKLKNKNVTHHYFPIQGNIYNYFEFHIDTEKFINSCKTRSLPRFYSFDQRRIGELNFIATIQHAVLNSLVENIIYLAKKNELDQKDFKILSENLVNNFCSENLTIISKKELKNNFNYIFKNMVINESENVLGVHNNQLTKLINIKSYYENQLNASMMAFRSFCSWGGTEKDLGLLNPFLTSPHLIYYVFEQLKNGQKNYEPINCKNYICRKNNKLNEEEKYRFIADSYDLFCTYFKDISNYPETKNVSLKKWNETMAIDDYKLQVMQVLSSLQKTSNILALADGKNNLQILESNIDDYFLDWAKAKTASLIDQLKFEETISLSLRNRDQKKGTRQLNFDINYGEYDFIQGELGKLKTFVNLKFKKSLIQHLYNEIYHSANWSQKKEKHLKNVIKYHVQNQLEKIYAEFFFFIPENEFFDNIADGIFTDVQNSDSKAIKKFNGNYKSNFYYGHYALAFIQKEFQTKK